LCRNGKFVRVKSYIVTPHDNITGENTCIGRVFSWMSNGLGSEDTIQVAAYLH
jgi:hypothetical protein